MQLQSTDDIKRLGTILGVWAHPDDETYAMAGILIAAIKNGQKVVCITATRGEAGVQDESRWPASQLASIRTAEQNDAFKILGITRCHMLDYPDGRCADVDSTVAVQDIAKIIHDHQPDSIFTFGPDGLTGHDDHKTVSSWTTLAVKKVASKAAIYHAVQTDEQYRHMQEPDKHLNIFFNIDKPPTYDGCVCDICYVLEPKVYEQKLSALRAMPSQTEAMLTKFTHILPEVLGVEAFRRYK